MCFTSATRRTETWPHRRYDPANCRSLLRDLPTLKMGCAMKRLLLISMAAFALLTTHDYMESMRETTRMGIRSLFPAGGKVFKRNSRIYKFLF